jgi:hypothetical protein
METARRQAVARLPFRGEEGVADGNERDVLERRQAAGELADRHEGAQLTDELGGRRGHRLQVHGVDLGRPRAGAHAQGIDGDHDEAASVMCSARPYPRWPGMCMSQYALR